MKVQILVIFLFWFCITRSQNFVNWDGKYQLQFSDFQSSATEVGKGSLCSVAASAAFDFSFQMTQMEFMFTKNFNSKVNCTFQRNASYLIAVDSAMAYQLLKFSRYTFDLAELYARKIRKRMYEEKDAFSEASFFRPIYEQVTEEFNRKHAESSKRTDIGRNEEMTRQLQEETLKEIDALKDFCKTCKPPKKKKAN